MGRIVRERIRPDLKPEFVADSLRERNDTVSWPAFLHAIKVGQSRQIDGEFVTVECAAVRPAILIGEFGMDVSVKQVAKLKR